MSQYETLQGEYTHPENDDYREASFSTRPELLLEESGEDGFMFPGPSILIKVFADENRYEAHWGTDADLRTFEDAVKDDGDWEVDRSIDGYTGVRNGTDYVSWMAEDHDAHQHPNMIDLASDGPTPGLIEHFYIHTAASDVTADEKKALVQDVESYIDDTFDSL